MNIFQTINPFRVPANIDPEDNLRILQERILQFILLGATIFGLLVITAVGVRDIPNQKYLLISIYTVIYLGNVVITFNREVSFQARVYILLSLIFLIGLVDLVEFGMSGEGRISLIAFTIVAGGLLGTGEEKRRFFGIYALVLVMITLTTVGYLMSQQIIPVPPIENMATSGNFGQWLNGNLVFLLMSVMAISVLTTLTSGLNSALQNQTNLAKDLQSERTSLESRVEERTQELERRASELEAASLLARDISMMTDLEELLNTAVELIRKEFGFYHAGLFLLDEQKEFAVLRAATGDAGKLMLQNKHRLKVGEVGIVGYVVSKGESRIALNVGEDAFHYNNPLLPKTQSELALPLKISDKIIGALDVQSTKADAFSKYDLVILQTIADQLAVAIEKAELVDQLQKNIKEIEKTQKQFADKSWKKHLTGAQSKYAYRYQQNKIEQISAQSNEEIEAIRTGEKVISKSKDYGAPGNKFVSIAIPIKLRDKVLGAINVKFEQENITKEMLQLLEVSSDRLAVALDNARLLEEIQIQAERDRMVSDISNKVRASTSIEEILRTAASELGRSFGVSEVVVQLQSDK